jgi:hypothetical protein
MTLTLPPHLRNRYLLLLDAILLGLCTQAAYFVRFEGFQWGEDHLRTALIYLACIVPLKLGILVWAGLYRRLWRFAGVAELQLILVATAISASVAAFVGAAVLPGLGITPLRVPLSVLFIDACLSAGAIAMSGSSSGQAGGTMAAAGDARRSVAKALASDQGAARPPAARLNPVAADDDPSGTATAVRPAGLRPCSDQGAGAPAHVEEIIIAMPRAPGATVSRWCGWRWKWALHPTVPGSSTSSRRGGDVAAQVEIQTCLRDAIQTDSAVRVLATGETVLVSSRGRRQRPLAVAQLDSPRFWSSP